MPIVWAPRLPKHRCTSRDGAGVERVMSILAVRVYLRSHLKRALAILAQASCDWLT